MLRNIDEELRQNTKIKASLFTKCQKKEDKICTKNKDKSIFHGSETIIKKEYNINMKIFKA